MRTANRDDELVNTKDGSLRSEQTKYEVDSSETVERIIETSAKIYMSRSDPKFLFQDLLFFSMYSDSSDKSIVSQAEKDTLSLATYYRYCSNKFPAVNNTIHLRALDGKCVLWSGIIDIQSPWLFYFHIIDSFSPQERTKISVNMKLADLFSYRLSSKAVSSCEAQATLKLILHYNSLLFFPRLFLFFIKHSYITYTYLFPCS